MHIPIEFQQELKSYYGEKAQTIIDGYGLPPETSVRLNKRKGDCLFDGQSQIPWCDEGRFLLERPIFASDPLWHAGAYYVQEAASMVLNYALRKTTMVDKPIRVLDLCASPGGKTTLLADVVHPESLIVANEVISTRVATLKENLTKWGYQNFIITSKDPSDFAPLSGHFDLVLVDAPCSGEGLFRKMPEATKEWGLGQVEMCAARQKRILREITSLIAPKGLLIYSTCTLNRQENIANVAELVENGDFESIKIEIPKEWGAMELQEANAVGYQCAPGLFRGEGFFFSVMQKVATSEILKAKTVKIDWAKREKLTGTLWDFVHENSKGGFFWRKENLHYFDTPFIDLAERLFTLFKPFLAGTELGTFKGKDFIPSHQLCMAKELLTDLVWRENLPKEIALEFLRKNDLRDFDIMGNGAKWLLAAYEDMPLGWLKRAGNRFNNYYPTEFRLRK